MSADTGISRSFISELERGVKKNASKKTVTRLAEGVKADVEAITHPEPGGAK